MRNKGSIGDIIGLGSNRGLRPGERAWSHPGRRCPAYGQGDEAGSACCGLLPRRMRRIASALLAACCCAAVIGCEKEKEAPPPPPPPPASQPAPPAQAKIAEKVETFFLEVPFPPDGSVGIQRDPPTGIPLIIGYGRAYQIADKDGWPIYHAGVWLDERKWVYKLEPPDMEFSIGGGANGRPRFLGTRFLGRAAIRRRAARHRVRDRRRADRIRLCRERSARETTTSANTGEDQV